MLEEGGIESLMEKMKILEELTDEVDQEELLRRFEKIESQTLECKRDQRSTFQIKIFNIFGIILFS